MSESQCQSDSLSMPTEQFFPYMYVMTRISCISMRRGCPPCTTAGEYLGDLHLHTLLKQWFMGRHVVNNISATMYIATVSFIGGGNHGDLRKPQTCRKSLTNIIT